MTLRALSLLAISSTLLFGQTSPFTVEEATIGQIHDAMKAGTLTCQALVTQYLHRIEVYDKNGPAINSIVVLNPKALAEATELDRRFQASGLIGPLHCIPMVVKDNFETVGLQSANGALAFAGYIAARDAFEVKKIREAGALILAKTNMAEWAFTPYETVSSILPGYTRNPYDTSRVTAGSSGGTAASVAASFATVGLGTDTGNSIRGPSSHQALVGIRSTMGLTSRAGVFPLSLRADIAGPMARTVEDAVKVFQVVVGEDPNDPATVAALTHPIPNYSDSLRRDGLRGAVIGVLHEAYDRESADPEVIRVFKAAIDDLRRAGATVIDPAPVEGYAALKRNQDAGPCMGFKYDLNAFLAARGDQVPMHNLAEIIKSGKFHPTVQRRLEQAEQGASNGPDSAACAADTAYRDKLRDDVNTTMDKLKLDAFVYPTWSNPPRLIGDLNTPAGDNSQIFSPGTGFPAITVPMGYTRGQLPAGMSFFGRAWSEATLIRLAYSYEQATRHRRPPASTPPLR
jgi:Asp-tRNA(Asn)/Glu-tRNA(Gln) amidotransferase A subunit family amidase